MWSICFLAAVLFCPVALRPLYIHRGLSVEEWKAHWLGDDLIPDASPSGSRAIIIDAPIESVWPWITQIGQDRGGFYSYRVLENLVGAEMPDVRVLRDCWARREVGQKLVMAPTAKFGPIAQMEIVVVLPEQALVARNEEGTWAFILVPINRQMCRFIARGTWKAPKNILLAAFRYLIFDPIHYVMEWRMMRGIKSLAERHHHKALLRMGVLEK